MGYLQSQNYLHFWISTEKFKAIYSPSNKIAIDEPMCPFRGRFKYLVYEPNKPHKWGVKLINECDSATGILFGNNSIPWTGNI